MGSENKNNKALFDKYLNTTRMLWSVNKLDELEEKLSNIDKQLGEHAKEDTEHLASLNEKLAVLNARFDGFEDVLEIMKEDSKEQKESVKEIGKLLTQIREEQIKNGAFWGFISKHSKLIAIVIFGLLSLAGIDGASHVIEKVEKIEIEPQEVLK